MEWTGGFRPTERDLEIVKWLGRVRLARAGQVAERFAMTETKAYARLRGLRGMGLVRHVRRGVPGPGVFLATGQGLRATGLDLAEATVSAASLHHDLTVVDVGTGLERQRLRVETERELRRAGRTLEVRITRAGVKAAHLPDLAIAGDGRRSAVEVELTQKGNERTRAILHAYPFSSEYDQVVYVVPDLAASERIRRLGRKEQLDARYLAIAILGETLEQARAREQAREQREQEEAQARYQVWRRQMEEQAAARDIQTRLREAEHSRDLAYDRLRSQEAELQVLRAQLSELAAAGPLARRRALQQLKGRPG